jgi:hypothetical protein
MLNELASNYTDVNGVTLDSTWDCYEEDVGNIEVLG